MSPVLRSWRRISTALAFFIFGCGALLLGLVLGLVLPLARLAADKRTRLVRESIRHLCRFYLRILRNLGLFTYRYHGFQGVDPAGKLIVANHPTLLDAIFLMVLIPNATFVVKAAMARHWLIGGVARLAGYIPNDQDGLDLLERATSALQRGEALVIFPAGTRSSGGDVKFKRGAANIAVATGCRIIPLRIDCHPLALQKNQKWYHVPPRKPHFAFRALPEIVVQDVIDTSRPTGIQARHLNEYLQNCLNRYESNNELPAISSAGV